MNDPTIVFLGGPDHGRIRMGQDATNIMLLFRGLSIEPGAVLCEPCDAIGRKKQFMIPWYMLQCEELGIDMMEAVRILETAGIKTGVGMVYTLESVGDPIILRYVGDEGSAVLAPPSTN